MAEEGPGTSAGSDIEKAADDSIAAPQALRDLFFHCDDLLHSRIATFLVAESIFFAAATSAWGHRHLVTLMAIVGIVFAAMFSATNAKLYWRIAWLLQGCEAADPLFREWRSLERMDLSRLGAWDRWAVRRFRRRGGQRRFQDAGFQFTRVFPLLVITVWGCLTAISLMDQNSAWPPAGSLRSGLHTAAAMLGLAGTLLQALPRFYRKQPAIGRWLLVIAFTCFAASLAA